MENLVNPSMGPRQAHYVMDKRRARSKLGTNGNTISDRRFNGIGVQGFNVEYNDI